MFKLIYLLAFSIISFSANAANIVKNFEQGGSDRGGGDGIYIDGKLYLLDLVEAGAENISGEGSRKHPRVAKLIAEQLAHLNLKNPEILENKLLEWSEYWNHPKMFMAILLLMKNVNWSLINVELKDVGDEDTEVICNTKCVQLAVRRDNSIYIVKKLFEELSPTNQAALIMHEIIYAALDNGTLSTSREIRKIVGYLFHSQTAYAAYASGSGNIYDMFSAVLDGYDNVSLKALQVRENFSSLSPTILVKTTTYRGSNIIYMLDGENRNMGQLDWCDNGERVSIDIEVRANLLTYFYDTKFTNFAITLGNNYTYDTGKTSSLRVCEEKIYKPLKKIITETFDRDFSPF